MSGTEEQENLNSQAGSEGKQDNAGNQAGSDNTAQEIAALKEQIADLRKEAANYRTKAKGKETVEEQLKALQDEFAKTKRENRLVKNQALLDKAGCIKSDLVASVIPDDCDNIQEWIDNYKKENEVLFKSANHGGNYKPSSSSNVDPHNVINDFIRSRSGR